MGSDPYDDITAPANGDVRWYYCRLNATGAVQVDTTHTSGYRNVLNTMVGISTGWVWGSPTSGVDYVKVTTDNGLTWTWALATGTIKLPTGLPTGWTWDTVTI